MSQQVRQTPNNQTRQTPNDRVIEYTGVTFDNLRAALCATYFLYQDMPQEEWHESLQYVIPMQHNFENPIEPGAQDTWIQFMIYNTENKNQTMKVSRITVRFLGKRAEVWAKAFHHLTKRRSVAWYFDEFCNASMLEYVSAITPVNVDYFGVTTTIAHDLCFDLHYNEVMEFDWQPLEYVSIPEGEIKIEGKIENIGGKV
jgi:hypothetical protein